MCPHCGKAMLLPHRFQKGSARERKKAKERIHREAEREHARLRIPDGRVGRRPSTVLLVMLGMVFVGALLVSRSFHVCTPKGDNPKILTARRNLDALRTAIERFHRDCGQYPVPGNRLKELVRNPGVTNWHGPYVNMVRPDPWEKDFCYELTNSVVTLYCCGPDGIGGTGDDIMSVEPSLEAVNWDLRKRLPTETVAVPVKIGPVSWK